ncbi:MAG: magnesium transporter [Halobacteriota archaeon]|nr:magnesium transporter [Halobacteriota archaeon]
MAFYSVRKIVENSIPVLMLTAMISIASGQILSVNQGVLIGVFPVLLILIPPLIKVGGDTGSILGARLSSALHLGLIDSKLERSSVIENSIIASFIIGIATCFILGIAVWTIQIILSINSNIGFVALVAISTIAGAIQMLIMFSMTTVIALLSHRFGMDPDDTVIPIITTSGDFFGIACIFLVMHLVGFI